MPSDDISNFNQMPGINLSISNSKEMSPKKVEFNFEQPFIPLESFRTTNSKDCQAINLKNYNKNL